MAARKSGGTRAKSRMTIGKVRKTATKAKASKPMTRAQAVRKIEKLSGAGASDAQVRRMMKRKKR